MSRAFDAGLKGLTTEAFQAARAQNTQPAAPARDTGWTLRTDGAGLGIAAAAPVTCYQGYGQGAVPAARIG